MPQLTSKQTTKPMPKSMHNATPAAIHSILKEKPSNRDISNDQDDTHKYDLDAKVMKQKSQKIDIGIEEKERKKIAGELSVLLADSYALYLKTHNFHWNVTGPMFRSLHKLFEQQYTELALSIDVIAERIRALGFSAPATFSQYLELSTIKEETEVPTAEEMISLLRDGQESVIRTARKMIPLVDKNHDLPTADLLTKRMQVHEKNAWMLRSLLSE